MLSQSQLFCLPSLLGYTLSGADWKTRAGHGGNPNPSSSQHGASRGHLWIEGQRTLPMLSATSESCALKRAGKDSSVLSGIMLVSGAAGLAFCSLSVLGLICMVCSWLPRVLRLVPAYSACRSLAVPPLGPKGQPSGAAKECLAAEMFAVG